MTRERSSRPGVVAPDTDALPHWLYFLGTAYVVNTKPTFLTGKIMPLDGRGGSAELWDTGF